MNITTKIITEVLQSQDIEGLIAAGAPSDEYDDESKIISLAISQSNVKTLNLELLHKIIIDVWTQAFNLSKSDILLRDKEIILAAQRILMLGA